MNNLTDLTDALPARPVGISLPPGTIVGYVAGHPVYNIAGGAPDGDDTGDDTGDDGGEDDGTSTDADDDSDVEDEAPKPKPPAKPEAPAVEEFTPPSEVEWRKIQAALKKANDDGKRHRLRNKELEEKTRTNETDHEKALREAEERGESRYRAPLIRTAALAALTDAGASGSKNRFLKDLDMDSLSVNEDGEIIGLEAEIDRIKAEFPECFQTATKAKPKVRPTAADRKPAEEKPKSSAEQHAMRVLGRAG
ncbi:hypothetical protein [Streptomyces sp. NPDC057580]|uniref:phage scaffolding protein n=1 Tax=Streptomyces sp. NPDC057580 TaxID=3346173 RepID=UPI0036942296